MRLKCVLPNSLLSVFKIQNCILNSKNKYKMYEVYNASKTNYIVI